MPERISTLAIRQTGILRVISFIPRSEISGNVFNSLAAHMQSTSQKLSMNWGNRYILNLCLHRIAGVFNIYLYLGFYFTF